MGWFWRFVGWFTAAGIYVVRRSLSLQAYSGFLEYPRLYLSWCSKIPIPLPCVTSIPDIWPYASHQSRILALGQYCSIKAQIQAPT